MSDDEDVQDRDAGDQTYHREVYDDWDPVDGAREEAHGTGLDFGLLLLRLGLLLLLPHGLAKAVDMPAFVRQVEANVVGGQAPEFFAWMIMLAQVALPVLVAVGLFTRPAAFLVAATMATIWGLDVVLRLDYVPVTPGGGLTGAGRWSLDAMRTAGRP